MKHSLYILLGALLALVPQSVAAQSVTIVSAGDSYASGEGAPDIPSPFGGAWLGDNGDGNAAFCHRSSIAGPAQAASRLGSAVTFRSVACSAAIIGPAMDSRLGLLGTNGQLARIQSLGLTVDALIMSIGGNDIGFASLVTSCLLPTSCNLDPTVVSRVNSLLAALPARLDTLFNAINSNAAGPVRRVFVTEYPDPTTGPPVPGASSPRFCGSFDWFFPLPAFQGFDGIDVGEAAFASAAVVTRLNAILAAAVARAANAPGVHPTWHFVSGITSRFATHGYCTGAGSPAWWTWSNPRYIGTLADSTTGQGDIRGAMHPNNLGQQQIGEALASVMRPLLIPPTAPPPPPPPPLWCIEYDERGKPRRVPCGP